MKNDFFRKNRKKSENPLDKRAGMWYNIKVIGRYTVSPGYAGMAELADALDSGSSEGNFMQVQFLLPAPKALFTQGFFFLFSRFVIMPI